MEIAKVMLIEDDPFIRTALSAGLSAYGITTEGAFSGAQPAVDLLKERDIDVAILDLDLGPGPTGIDIAYSLRRIKRTLGLVLLTSYSDPRLMESTMMPLPTGCRFFTKQEVEKFQVLVNAVISAKNDPYSPTKLTNGNTHGLTAPQLEVLRLVGSGFSSAQIAEDRGVSLKAVESIISKIYKTLELPEDRSVNKRVQLTRAYLTLIGKIKGER